MESNNIKNKEFEGDTGANKKISGATEKEIKDEKFEEITDDENKDNVVVREEELNQEADNTEKKESKYEEITEKKEFENSENKIDEESFEKLEVEEEIKKKLSEEDTLSERSEKLLDKIKKIRLRSFFNKEFDDNVKDLKEELDSLREFISDQRRQGKDVFVSSSKIKLVKPKIAYYEVTGSQKDYDAVKNLLAEILEEVNEEVERVEPDFKKEVLEAFKLEKKEVDK